MKYKKIIFSSCGGQNAGDAYCSPHLYYRFNNYPTSFEPDFWAKSDQKKYKDCVIIMGGGGILDINKATTKRYEDLAAREDDTNIYFQWSSGSNLINPKFEDVCKPPERSRSKKVSAMDFYKEEIETENKLENFKLVGRRDYLDRYLKNHQYVPCVSCKLPLIGLDYKISRRIGVINHMWTRRLRLGYDTINMNLTKYSMRDIISFIGTSEVIITSSYHGAYWAFLMGKKVIINGNWSSKFDFFKYPPTLLTGNIEKDIQNAKPAPSNYLEECISLNDKFHKQIMELI